MSKISVSGWLVPREGFEGELLCASLVDSGGSKQSLASLGLWLGLSNLCLHLCMTFLLCLCHLPSS